MPIATRPRLVLFPGLGLDHRLYAPQRDLPADIEIAPWIIAQPRETMGEYSRRLAKTIDPAGPLYLGGVSLGGMIALEAAAVLRPRGVFVVAGSRSGRALAIETKLACAVAQTLPDQGIRAAMLAAPLLVRMTGRPNRRQRNFLLDLARNAAPWLMRWGCGAILRWRGPNDVPCPVHHIHGSDDRMIPAQNVRPERIVQGGGHVINVTHAAEVNSFIAARLV